MKLTASDGSFSQKKSFPNKLQSLLEEYANNCKVEPHDF